jgi:hypothetical protein
MGGNLWMRFLKDMWNIFDMVIVAVPVFSALFSAQ